MENKNRYFKASILMFIGAICFAIVTYANFYEGKTFLGFLCLVATICDSISCILNYKKYKQNN